MFSCWHRLPVAIGKFNNETKLLTQGDSGCSLDSGLNLIIRKKLKKKRKLLGQETSSIGMECYIECFQKIMWKIWVTRTKVFSD